MTALVYQGPGLARQINEELSQLLERDGFKYVAEAVGVDVARHIWANGRPDRQIVENVGGSNANG